MNIFTNYVPNKWGYLKIHDSLSKKMFFVIDSKSTIYNDLKSAI